jgi:hypothetical protein
MMDLKQRDATLKAWEHMTWVALVVGLAGTAVLRTRYGWSQEWTTYSDRDTGLYLASGAAIVLGWVFLGASVVSAVRRSWYRASLVVDKALMEIEDRRVCTGCVTARDVGMDEYGDTAVHVRAGCPVHEETTVRTTSPGAPA